MRRNAALFSVLVVTLYFGSYAVLWDAGHETKYSFTKDRGCITSQCDVRLLTPYSDSHPVASKTLRVLFWPVNAVFDSISTWHEKSFH